MFNTKNLSDPLKLLEKLEGYSNDQFDKMNLEDKESLLREIELYLSQGITPLQKYYDQLKEYFSVPSKTLLKFDQNYFYKQVDKVRKAQKEEIKNVKKNAETAARNLIDKIMVAAKETMKIEMTSIIKQFEEMDRELNRKEFKIHQYEQMIKSQEDEIIMIRSFNKYCVGEFGNDAHLSCNFIFHLSFS